MKTTALFKFGKTAAPAKAAPAKAGKAAKKVAKAAPKQSSGKSTGGWLGSGSKNINLDKW